MIFDEIKKLVEDVKAQGDEYGEKLDAILPNVKLLPSAPSLIPAISQGLRKLEKTAKVMRHKMESLKSKAENAKRHAEQARKPDLGAIKIALQVQLEVAKVANKQADFILRQFDAIGKK